MWIVFMLFQAAGARAGCAFSALEACAIPAHSCHYWNVRCGGVADITANLAVSNGEVQAYIVSSPTGPCDGYTRLGLCGYPRGTSRCHETQPIPFGGSCILALKNTNLVEGVTVNGSFSATALPWDDAGGNFLSTNATIAVGVLTALAFMATVGISVLVLATCRSELRANGRQWVIG